MDLPLLLFISAACGAAVKLADSYADSGKKGFWGVLAGIAYGLMIGYLAAATQAATIFIAAVLASAFAGKIDKKEHFAGVVVLFFYMFITSMFIASVQIENVALLAVFAIAAYIDEMKPLWGYRGLLDIAAILAGIAGFGWEPAMFIILFDTGYIAVSKIYPEAKSAGKKNAKRAGKGR